MIPAAFDYVRAGSAEEAIALLGEHGDEAKLLAGGHSLLPMMKLRLAVPSVLVDIGRVDVRPLHGLAHGDGPQIGARHRTQAPEKATDGGAYAVNDDGCCRGAVHAVSPWAWR